MTKYNTLVYAHRGASGYMPENTNESFEKAVELGADGMELDIQLSKDGKIMVCHDYRIDRTSDGKGFLKDFTYEELRRFNFSNGREGFYRIPLLEEVLELVKANAVILNIELKSDAKFSYEGMEDKVVAMVKDMKVEDKIVYSSFNHYSVKRMQALAPELFYGLLEESRLIDTPGYVAAQGVDAVHPE